MEYIQKALLMDDVSIERSLKRIAHQIIERDEDEHDLCFIGIRRRGVPLAHTIASYVEQFSDIKAPVGELDITLYRDDLTEMSAQATVNNTSIPFDVNGKTVILVDDVIYTGRTTRAAIDAIISLGRPAYIQLAVLIDRGHRELPIRPDYIGKNVPTSRKELIEVRLDEIDGRTEVAILEQK